MVQSRAVKSELLAGCLTRSSDTEAEVVVVLVALVVVVNVVSSTPRSVYG